MSTRKTAPTEFQLGDKTIFFPEFSGPLGSFGSDSSVVEIAKNGQAKYCTIKDAIENESTPGTIYLVRPGIYVEDNPLIIPQGSLLTSLGSPVNTTIVAANPNLDLLVLNAWSIVKSFSLHDASGVGSRGVYFDGSVLGTGALASIELCLIRNCNIGIEAEGGKDTLLIYRTLIHPTAGPVDKGVYVHNGGTVISTDVRTMGLPAPYNIPMEYGLLCEDIGSKMTLQTTSIHNCTNALTINNDAEYEISLLIANGNTNGLVVGPDGTNSKVRAGVLRLLNSSTYDIDVQSTHSDIEIFSGELDQNKVNNPNGIKLNSAYLSNQAGKYAQVYTGRIRIGTQFEPTSSNFGEGRYILENIATMTNDNLEIGTWLDVSADALSFEGSEFDYFQGTSAGNCLYVGSLDYLVGIRTCVTVATTSIISTHDLCWEYWDGVNWTRFYTMQNITNAPYANYLPKFVSEVNKYQVRFGLKGANQLVLKTLNGVEKFWVRCRIINDLPSVPKGEYIKIHAHNAKHNSDGWLEYYGNSRPIGRLPWDITITKPNNSSPGNQTIYLSDNMGMGLTDNNFQDGSLDRIAFNGLLPQDIDFSFPIKVKVVYMGSSNSSGDVEWFVKFVNTNVGTGVYMTTMPAPTDHADTVTTTKITNIGVNTSETEQRETFEMQLTNINPRPAIGEEDMLWISIERNGAGSNDTYSGDIALVQINLFYIKWCEGGHILDY